MSIRFKLIIMFVVLIVSVSLPLSLYNLQRQEVERTESLVDEGRKNTRVMTRLVINVLLSNGGDLRMTRVDANDLLTDLAFIRSGEVLFAEVVTQSKNPERNGKVIFQYGDPLGRVPAAEYDKLVTSDFFRETKAGSAGDVFEFISTGYFSNGVPACSGRIVYSKNRVFEPIYRARRSVYISTVIAICFAILFAYILSKLITRPVYKLITQVQSFESGSIDTISPIQSRDEIGKLAGTFYHLTRMVDLKIKELKHTNEELLRIDRLKDEFMSNMSHELQLPVHGMTGIAETLIGSHRDLPAEVTHNLSLIAASGKRLSHLVDDIRDFSKLRHSDIKLKVAPVDLYSLADQVIAILSPLISRKQIHIHNRIERDRAIVRGDENRIHQIMMNLISNAVKFTEKGEVTLAAEKKGGFVVLTVADTGIGIAPEKIGEVFDTFERSGRATSHEYGGTGIGLAIAKNLVELHGGSIWAESETGKGTVFHVKLPASRRSESLRTHESGTGTENAAHDIQYILPDGYTGAAGKVLVIDDDPVDLQLMVNYLHLENYKLMTAVNGLEALDMIDEELPDVVLVDIMMPVISGFETCRRIREKYPQHELPVILLTTHGRTEEISAGFEAGANDYLVKPVQRVDLACRVSSLVSLRRSILDRDELVNLKRDIHIAHMIQEGILGEPMPAVEGMTVELCYRPMYELGGDFYELRKLDDNRLSVLVADVSGHGIPAALLCSMLKISCDVSRTDAAEPSAFLTSLNAILSRYAGGNFVTACYAVFDKLSSKVISSNAGHWPPLLIRRGSVVEPVSADKSGTPMGWVPDERYSQFEFDVEPGDRVILYTDCFVDGRSPDGKMFGENGFFSLLEESSAMTPQQAVAHAMKGLRRWLAIESDANLPDDATMVIVDIS